MLLCLLIPVKLQSKCSNSANIFLEFQTSEGHQTPAFCGSGGLGPENFCIHLRRVVGWTYLGF